MGSLNNSEHFLFSMRRAICISYLKQNNVEINSFLSCSISHALKIYYLVMKSKCKIIK